MEYTEALKDFKEKYESLKARFHYEEANELFNNFLDETELTFEELEDELEDWSETSTQGY